MGNNVHVTINCKLDRSNKEEGKGWCANYACERLEFQIFPMVVITSYVLKRLGSLGIESSLLYLKKTELYITVLHSSL